ncbi:tetratricopeptide repeat protein [Labrenzia suaedae]|uniref:Tetratricopeptide repeat protein n=1 Tax=Roseibium litorale TaxID=2803841 RepID=A0ABR9CSC5_9HYPH|nr:tetratricopeptide repeat protein [Roseibium litorale]
MRFFVFLLFLFALPAGVFAQPVPELDPDSEAPSIEDLDPMLQHPDENPSQSGQEQGKSDAPGSDGREPGLNDLYSQLAEAPDDTSAARIARRIQITWLESGSATVDLLMSRSAQALKSSDYGLALDLLDVVVTLAPDYAEGWNRRATVYYLQEDFGRSLVDIERTLALEPRHWGALSGLAMIQRRLGEKDRALATFHQILKIHPGLSNARDAVEALEKGSEGEGI